MIESYTSLVDEHVEALHDASMLRAATNIAALLDSHAFTFPPGEINPTSTGKDVGQQRWRLLQALQVALAQVGFSLPGDDICLVQLVGCCYLYSPGRNDPSAPPHRQLRPEVTPLVEDLVASLAGRTDPAAWRARAIVDLMCTMEQLNQYGSISFTAALAAVNIELAEQGGSPTLALPGAPDPRRLRSLNAPRRDVGEAKVLIVDDRLDEVVNTALAIAGWPTVALSALLHRRDESGHGVENLARQIVELNPDIVLMDQMLAGVLGSDVVRWMDRNLPRHTLVVANSGGDGRELHEAGALQNCCKGENFRGLERAIALLNSGYGN